MHTTDYHDTLITVSPDTKAAAATPPPTGKGSVAELHFEMMHGHDYELTSDDVIFEVFADRNGIASKDRSAARDQFFCKGQPCLRTSPLAKTYGWGIHSNTSGRVALVPMESSRYNELVKDDATLKKAAMKVSR